MGRKSDPVIYPGGAVGRQVSDGFPEGVIGYLQPHEYASPKMLHRARSLFPERDISEFEVIEPPGGRPIFIEKSTGREFRREEAAVLIDPQNADHVECFVVDAGSRLHLLRPRGPRAPTESRIMSTATISRRIG